MPSNTQKLSLLSNIVKYCPRSMGVTFFGWVLSIVVFLSLATCSLFQADPVAPSRVKVSVLPGNGALISWQNNEPEANGIVVEARYENGPWVGKVRLKPSQDSWKTESGLAQGTWYFMVSAETDKGVASSDAASIYLGSSNPVDASNWDNTGWSLAWNDEFNGTSVDTSKWAYDTGVGENGWGNNELQYYQASNASISVDSSDSANTGRALEIIARKENVGGMFYSSARIKTQGIYAPQYGRIEARMKLPKGKGMWPAFWMLGSSITTVGWPACGEIDIMELVGGSGKGEVYNNDLSDSAVFGTLHWKNAAGTRSYEGITTTLASGTFADAYHLFGIEWDASKIAWYIDGTKFAEKQISEAERSEFKAPFFIILNLAVGGNLPGAPDVSTIFPQSMWVDWVRVWRK